MAKYEQFCGLLLWVLPLATGCLGAEDDAQAPEVDANVNPGVPDGSPDEADGREPATSDAQGGGGGESGSVADSGPVGGPDGDADGIPDARDNCPAAPNPRHHVRHHRT